jgi:hypothetical protein
MTTLRIVSTMALAAALVAGSADFAAAQGRGRGNDKKPEKKAETAVVVTQFGTHDREIITTYYTRASRGRREGLPPGLEKQLIRNGTLPPGLQKKLQPFPRGLEIQLPPLAPGYRRAIVGNHVVVYKVDNYSILDVILDIVK